MLSYLRITFYCSHVLTLLNIVTRTGPFNGDIHTMQSREGKSNVGCSYIGRISLILRMNRGHTMHYNYISK